MNDLISSVYLEINKKYSYTENTDDTLVVTEQSSTDSGGSSIRVNIRWAVTDAHVAYKMQQNNILPKHLLGQTYYVYPLIYFISSLRCSCRNIGQPNDISTPTPDDTIVVVPNGNTLTRALENVCPTELHQLCMPI